MGIKELMFARVMYKTGVRLAMSWSDLVYFSKALKRVEDELSWFGEEEW